MLNLLEQHGYTYTGKCHCDGVETEKYSSGPYEIRVRVRAQIFKVKQNGRSITQWIPISKLEDSLKLYSNVAVQA